jgi:hypothetical protein
MCLWVLDHKINHLLAKKVGKKLYFGPNLEYFQTTKVCESKIKLYLFKYITNSSFRIIKFNYKE